MMNVQVTWTEFKTLITKTGSNVFYYQTETAPDKYSVALATDLFLAQALVTQEADVTDFEENYQSSATATTTEGGVIAFSLSTISFPNATSKMVFKEGLVTGTGDYQTVVSHTVATGKTFYLTSYRIHRSSDHNKRASIRVKVDSTIRDRGFLNAGETNSSIELFPPRMIPFASSGQIIIIELKQEDRTGTGDWSAVMIGAEK